MHNHPHNKGGKRRLAGCRRNQKKTEILATRYTMGVNARMTIGNQPCPWRQATGAFPVQDHVDTLSRRLHFVPCIVCNTT
ncbi:hypothetical protein VTK56DRAFT_3919 [Thermocarpiscus australiensis]